VNKAGWQDNPKRRKLKGLKKQIRSKKIRIKSTNQQSAMAANG
jgi:hypothetical protein